MSQQSYIDKLIAEGMITPTNDKHDGKSYKFYEIAGVDPSKVRLAVWIGSKKTIAWSLSGYDKRDVFFALGDRKDLCHSYSFAPSLSWRDDTGNALKYGHDTPYSWMKAIIDSLK